MEYTKLNKRIISLVEKAEELSLSDISKGINFHPYLIYGEKLNKIKRLITDNIDNAIDLAEEVIEDIEDNIETIVLVFKDEIKFNNDNYDAIVFQIYDEDEDNGYSFCQIYKIENNKIILLDEKLFLGYIRNILIF